MLHISSPTWITKPALGAFRNGFYTSHGAKCHVWLTAILSCNVQGDHWTYMYVFLAKINHFMSLKLNLHYTYMHDIYKNKISIQNIYFTDIENLVVFQTMYVNIRQMFNVLFEMLVSIQICSLVYGLIHSQHQCRRRALICSEIFSSFNERNIDLIYHIMHCTKKRNTLILWC